MSLDLEGGEVEHFQEDDDKIGQRQRKLMEQTVTYCDIRKLDCAPRDWVPDHNTFIFLLGLVLQEDINPWPTRKAHRICLMLGKDRSRWHYQR